MSDNEATVEEFTDDELVSFLAEEDIDALNEVKVMVMLGAMARKILTLREYVENTQWQTTGTF